MSGYRQLDARVTVEARSLHTQSRVRRVGADSFICETRLPDLGVELRSTYAVRDGLPYGERVVFGSTANGDPAGPREASPPHPADEVRCVLDHFSHLRPLLHHAIEPVRIEVYGWRFGYPWTRHVPDQNSSPLPMATPPIYNQVADLEKASSGSRARVRSRDTQANTQIERKRARHPALRGAA
jgi:hypothetical protein